MADVKIARPDTPIHQLIARRWSPYAFADRPVSPEDLRALFEAARWAPSSYNEQPWRFVVATREDPDAHARLLACLVDGNQTWAKRAPVLALGLVRHTFSLNGKENKAAVHDLGLAAAHLTFEATARGLAVHQMIGILPDVARETYAIPAGEEAFTGLAIGYPGEAQDLPEALRPRDEAPRQRKPLTEFVFGARHGEPASFLAG